MIDTVIEETEDIIDQLSRSGYTINEVAYCLNCNRATVRIKNKAPLTITLHEIVELAALLNKTPLYVAKLLLRQSESTDEQLPQLQKSVKERLIDVQRGRSEGRIKQLLKRKKSEQE